MAAGRFYIQNASPDYDPATERGTWDNVSSYAAKKLSKTKSGAIASKSIAETSAANNYDVLVIKAVSEALLVDKIISGNVKWCLGMLESNSSANMYAHLHMFVTQGDSDNVRGTLLSNFSGANEWDTASSTCGIAASDQAMTSVNAVAGDRIVIEIGYQARNTSSYSYTGTLWSGGTSGTDLTTGANPANYPGWFEFSNDPFDAQLLSVGGIASSASIGTPTLAPGNVNLPLTGIPANNQFGTLTLTVPGGNQILALTGIAANNQFGVVTMVPGPVALSLSGIPANNQFGVPTLTVQEVMGMVKVGGTWVNIIEAYTKVGGVWILNEQIKGKVSGEWK